jgi:hypothetical protein
VPSPFSITGSEVLPLRKDTAATVCYDVFSAPDIADSIGDSSRRSMTVSDARMTSRRRSLSTAVWARTRPCLVTHIAQQSHCGHNLPLWMGGPCKGKRLSNNTFESVDFSLDGTDVPAKCRHLLFRYGGCPHNNYCQCGYR